MKIAIKIAVALLLAASFQSCIPSLYPLYKRGDLRTDTRLPGQWVTDDDEKWVFTQTEYSADGLYYLSVGKGQEFEARLLELGGHFFLDLLPLEPTNVPEGEEFYRSHFVPVHTFARVEVQDERLNVHFFDTDWLEKLFEEKKVRIRHEELEEGFLLSAATEELQKFVLKYVNTPEAYLDQVTFKRTGK